MKGGDGLFLLFPFLFRRFGRFIRVLLRNLCLEREVRLANRAANNVDLDGTSSLDVNNGTVQQLVSVANELCGGF
jgi:hypothetical protein